MNTHTKGAWHIGEGNGEGSIFADSGRTRFESGGTTLYPICEINSGWDEGEDAANARLIASAPELLDALRVAESELRYHATTRNSEALNIVRAAIQKATGETL
jgi:hypothetical protein